MISVPKTHIYTGVSKKNCIFWKCSNVCNWIQRVKLFVSALMIICHRSLRLYRGLADIIHKQATPQKFSGEGVGCRQRAVSEHLDGKLTGRENMAAALRRLFGVPGHLLVFLHCVLSRTESMRGHQPGDSRVSFLEMLISFSSRTLHPLYNF